MSSNSCIFLYDATHYMGGWPYLISSDSDSDRRTAFSSKTQVNVVCKFLVYLR